MCIALPLKTQSDPHCNLIKRKSDEHTKHHLSVHQYKTLFATNPHSSSSKRERNRLWTESTALDRQRGMNHCMAWEANTGLGIILYGWCGNPSQSSSEMDAVIYYPSSCLRGWSPTDFLFLFSLPCHFNGFFIRVSSR